MKKLLIGAAALLAVPGAAQATPPSWKANRNDGNRWGTPPRKSERASVSPAVANMPMWL